MAGDVTEIPLPRPRNTTWRQWIDDWDRSMRSANHSRNTRYNYELAATQFADYLGHLAADLGRTPWHKRSSQRPYSGRQGAR